MKKVFTIIGLVILVLVTITITIGFLFVDSFSLKEEYITDIAKYREFEDDDHMCGDQYIFPKNIPDSAEEISYKYYKSTIYYDQYTYQIYLEYKLNEVDYNEEFNRISSMVIKKDNESFIYPAYVSLSGGQNLHEYVLFDKDNKRVIYVFTERTYKEEVKFDKEYLPVYYPGEKEKEELYNGLLGA